MKMHLQPKMDNLIRAVSAAEGRVVVNETTYRASVIITPSAIIDSWQPLDAQGQISTNGLRAVAQLAGAGDVVLLGRGEKSHPPTPEWHAVFIEKKVILESMSLRAAAHTYNIMLGDGRPVIAALVLD